MAKTAERSVSRNPDSKKSQHLLVVALKLFSERDYDAVTIKDIARVAKVNTALIYYYFENKEELFRAALETAVTNFLKHYENLIELHSNPVDLINDWFDTHVNECEAIQRLVKIMLDYSSTRVQNDIIDDVIRRFYEQERHLLVASIKKGIEQKIFEKVNAVQMSDFASTHLDGIITRSLIMKDLDVKKSVSMLKKTFWEQLSYNNN